MFKLTYNPTNEYMLKSMHKKGYADTKFSVVSICVFRTPQKTNIGAHKYIGGLSNFVASLSPLLSKSKGWILRIYYDDSLFLPVDIYTPYKYTRSLPHNETQLWRKLFSHLRANKRIQFVKVECNIWRYLDDVYEEKIKTSYDRSRYHCGLLMSLSRYLSLDDPFVKVSIIRDIDSPMHRTDIIYVRQFPQHGETFQFYISDHLTSEERAPFIIFGGLINATYYGMIEKLIWQFTLNCIANARNKIIKYNYGVDELFLNTIFKKTIINESETRQNLILSNKILSANEKSQTVLSFGGLHYTVFQFPTFKFIRNVFHCHDELGKSAKILHEKYRNVYLYLVNMIRLVYGTNNVYRYCSYTNCLTDFYKYPVFKDINYNVALITAMRLSILYTHRAYESKDTPAVIMLLYHEVSKGPPTYEEIINTWQLHSFDNVIHANRQKILNFALLPVEAQTKILATIKFSVH